MRLKPHKPELKLGRNIAMIIIFDLDYTLLNSKKFKAGLAAVLGLTEKEYAAACEEIFKSKKIHYNLRKHLDYLIIKGLTDKSERNKLNKKINEFFKRIDYYLFSQAEKVLSELEKRGNTLMLLTYGDVEWQKMKLKNLIIKKYFIKIIFVEEKKEKALDFLKGNKEKVWIINDNAQESLAMRKKIKNAEIFLVKGPYTYNAEHNLEAHRLGECLRLI